MTAKKIFYGAIGVLVLAGVITYLLPASPTSFFETYPKDDVYSQTLKEFQGRKTKTVHVDEVEWTYYSGGKGEKTILFLHGMGGAYDLWWNQVVAFENDYRIITYSLPEEIHSLHKVQEGILAILEKEGVEKVYAVGTSMGGYITQYLLRNHPEIIQKAVFGNTFPPNELFSETKGGLRKALPLVPEILLASLGKGELKNKLLPAGHNDPLLAAFLPSLPFSKKQFIGRFDVVLDFFEMNPSEYVIKRVPKLIVESDNDPLIPVQLRSQIKALYVDARVYTFHNEGHFPYLNAVEEFNEVLHDFFEAPNNYPDIETTLSNYFTGRRNADTKQLKRVFSADAILNTPQGDSILFIGRENYLNKVLADGKISVETSILSGDIQGNTAVFKTKFEYPDKTYVDFLTLIKQSDQWVIVNKTFSSIEE